MSVDSDTQSVAFARVRCADAVVACSLSSVIITI